MSEQKPLTARQAARCEEAKGDDCDCRCAGALHGARRGDNYYFTTQTPISGYETPREFFESLNPELDDHYVPSAAALAVQKRRRREEEQRRKATARAALESSRASAWDGAV